MPRFVGAKKSARWLLAGVFAAAVGVAAHSRPQERAGNAAQYALAPGDVWVRDVTLISPELPAALPHAHVVVRGERIAYAGEKMPGGKASGVTIVEGAGRYLTPGLIDGHVHLAEMPRPADGTPSPFAPAYFRQLPRSYVYFGFTAVVDLNIVDRERVEQIRKAEVAPDIFDCGNALALANGYPMNYAPPERRFEMYPNFLYDPRQADAIPKKYSPAEHTPEADVRRVADGGGICVKAHYEPGFDPRAERLPVPAEEMMLQVRHAAHAHHLPLLLHANSLEAHRFAADVGVDAVAHGLWNWQTPSDPGGAQPPAAVREVLDAERRAGIAYMPTSRVLGGLADMFDPAFLDDPRVAKVLPAELIAWYRTPDGQWFAKEVAAGLDGMPAEGIRRAFARHRERWTLAYVVAHGGKVLFGSDTPSSPTYANPPGYNGYLELREMEAAGMTPRQILAAATIEDARFFHLEDRYGTIQPGKVASLLVLRDNPLESIAAFDTIETVLLKGRVIPRATLAMKAQ